MPPKSPCKIQFRSRTSLPLSLFPITQPPATPGPFKRDVLHKIKGKGQNFVDFLTLKVEGGRGGDGCVSFLREKFIVYGPPSGGNGGKGGDVYFRASKNETSLHGLRYTYRAPSGMNGEGKRKYGESGQDLVVQIPVGTMVREVAPPASLLTNSIEVEKKDGLDNNLTDSPMAAFTALSIIKPELESDPLIASLLNKTAKDLKETTREKLFLDFTKHDEMQLVARGGRGGKGNAFFHRGNAHSPKVATRGFFGQTRFLELELKTIADIGLVGLPNAGKSTLLGAISRAHPKIGPYPFTTLNPFVGTVDYSDSFQLTVADIPGLVPGAHANIGLGHAFLRHIERSKMLAFVVDLGKQKPWEDIRILMEELRLYQDRLLSKRFVIIANKADMNESLTERNYRQMKEHFPGIRIVPVSAKYHKNILKLTSVLRELVESPLM